MSRLKFGDTVTYTLQVVNDNGDPVAHEGCRGYGHGGNDRVTPAL